jgi:hypothetical protein
MLSDYLPQVGMLAFVYPPWRSSSRCRLTNMRSTLSTVQVTAFFAWAYEDLINNFGNEAALIHIP